MQRVSGTAPVIKNATTGLSATAIIVGTLGKSPAIDALAAAGKLDTVGVAGKWESAVIQAVANPVAGVTSALVIAGSDRRGTVYGIYELSQRIGVSPWYWWADVTPTQSTTITVDGAVFKQGEPTVKYRGIFINDEENFTTWAGTKMDAGKKPGPETYKKVFELLLRLKANFLWPAMHPVSDEFNKYAENAANAESYGIVMGSSHPEMMLRNNVKEWDPWASAHGSPSYDYSVNPQTIYDYWDARVQTNGKYENGYSVGMRGEHDSGLVAVNAPHDGGQGDVDGEDLRRPAQDPGQSGQPRRHEDLSGLHTLQRGVADLQRRPEGPRRRDDPVGRGQSRLCSPDSRARPNACAREAPASTITSPTGEIRSAISGSIRRP